MITVAMITMNEEKAVGKVIADIRQAVPDAEILIVDSSRDSTPDIAEKAGARVIRQFPPKGYGKAMDLALRSGKGDVIITLSVYFIFALFKNDLGWLSALNKKDIILLAIVGFLIAVGIEQRAMLQGRWAYADVMPIIPYLKVGFMPILQMTLLLPFSIYLTKKLKKYE